MFILLIIYLTVLSERWHEETSSFHLPVREMTITLDDVSCLLGIPITGRILHDRELTHDEGIQMMQDHLHFTAKVGSKKVGKQGDAHVSFGKLKRRYEEVLHRCNQLIEPDTEDEHAEQADVRMTCIKAFLLLLLSYMSSYLLPLTHLWPHVVVT